MPSSARSAQLLRFFAALVGEAAGTDAAYEASWPMTTPEEILSKGWHAEIRVGGRMKQRIATREYAGALLDFLLADEQRDLVEACALALRASEEAAAATAAADARTMAADASWSFLKLPSVARMVAANAAGFTVTQPFAPAAAREAATRLRCPAIRGATACIAREPHYSIHGEYTYTYTRAPSASLPSPRRASCSASRSTTTRCSTPRSSRRSSAFRMAARARRCACEETLPQGHVGAPFYEHRQTTYKIKWRSLRIVKKKGVRRTPQSYLWGATPAASLVFLKRRETSAPAIAASALREGLPTADDASSSPPSAVSPSLLLFVAASAPAPAAYVIGGAAAGPGKTGESLSKAAPAPPLAAPPSTTASSSKANARRPRKRSERGRPSARLIQISAMSAKTIQKGGLPYEPDSWSSLRAPMSYRKAVQSGARRDMRSENRARRPEHPPKLRYRTLCKG